MQGNYLKMKMSYKREKTENIRKTKEICYNAEMVATTITDRL